MINNNKNGGRMANRLPTLSTDGNTDASDAVMIKLYLYFAVSEKAQTFMYDDNVASLKYILANNDSDDEIVDEITKTIIAMYDRYFRDTKVEVTIEKTDINVKRITIKIVSVDENNKTISLDQTVEIENSTIRYLDNNILDLYKGR